jgi:hypothetical protein
LQYTIQDLSFKVIKAEISWYVLSCRSETCTFSLRVIYSKRHHHAVTTVSRPHICSPDTHNGWKMASSMQYLASVHATNQSLNSTQIRATELLKWSTCSRGILRVCNDYYIAIRSLYCRRENGCLIERAMTLVRILTYRYIWESPWGNHLDPETTTTHSNIADLLTSESWADLLIRSFR